MKAIRTLTLALGLVATLPLTAAAQEGQHFDNSWFWGAKAGTMTFWTSRVQHQPAPIVGAEWLITRRRAALLISGEQSFFEEQSAIYDPSAPSQQRTVDIKDMRRASFTLLGFPEGMMGHRFIGIRPYAGLGFSWSFIQQANGVGVPTGTAQGDTILARIEDVKSAGAPHLMVGAQGQFRRVVLFGQGTMMWSHKRFLLNNNESYILEGGVRINFGSSIERPD
jgi:hypothetical protein